MAGKRHFPLDPPPSLKKILQTFLRALPPMFTPVILIGGIMIGMFTPTEAGAVAAVYAFFLTFIIYREVKLKELIAMLIRVVSRIGSFLLILSTSALYANILARLETPQFITEKLFSISSDPIILLLIINIFLLIVGCVMEALAALTILAPILSSICEMVGIDPVHFGVIVVFNLMIGSITPPVGVCMFIVNKITNISTLCFIKKIWPFIICLVVVLFMITYIPGLSLFLPNLFMGK
jgi:tripartite ATP-independent transporter DctM subunit